MTLAVFGFELLKGGEIIAGFLERRYTHVRSSRAAVTSEVSTTAASTNRLPGSLFIEVAVFVSLARPATLHLPFLEVNASCAISVQYRKAGARIDWASWRTTG